MTLEDAIASHPAGDGGTGDEGISNGGGDGGREDDNMEDGNGGEDENMEDGNGGEDDNMEGGNGGEDNVREGSGRVEDDVVFVVPPRPDEADVMEVDEEAHIFDVEGIEGYGDCEPTEPPPVPAGHTYPDAAELYRVHEEQKQERARKQSARKKIQKHFQGIRAAIVQSIKVSNEYKVRSLICSC
jgi:hypothetical protein